MTSAIIQCLTVAILSFVWWRACRKWERRAAEWEAVAMEFRALAMSKEAELDLWRSHSGRKDADSDRSLS